MKRKFAIAILASLFLVPSASAQFNLSLKFTDMGPHIGQRFEIRVTDKSDNNEVGKQVIKTIETDTFSVNLYVLLKGHSYNVDFYADLSQNGTYDAPPIDHAWRRMVANVTQDVVINFSHDTTFTDIQIPDPFDFSYYNATWGGRWMNSTFGSSDTIQATTTIACDSVMLLAVTSGLFGNPDTVMFEFGDTVPDNFDPACDSIIIQLTAPLTGELILFNGMMSGDFLEPGTGIGLQFVGNYGAGQQLFQYTVLSNGFPFANGFSYMRELEVDTIIPAVDLSLEASSDVSCAGSADGAIILAVQGGVAPIDIMWSDGGLGLSRTDLPAGWYFITATDVNGCTDTLTVVIQEPDSMVVTVNIQYTSCYGESDGSAELIVSGGCPPYMYGINGGPLAITNVFSDLSAGTYEVVVTDAKGCQVNISFVIEEPGELFAQAIATGETAPGASDGTASATPAGGTPPYTFLWSTGETTAMISGLSPATYTVSVTDNNGCLAVDTDTVSAFGCELTVEIRGIAVICPGETTVLVAMSSSEPVTYAWNEGSNTQSVEVLAGRYFVTVTDVDGCTALDTFVVSEFDLMTIDSIVVTNEIGGGSNGSISILHSGGAPPYAYAWSRDGTFYSTEKDITGLSAGTYCVVITDSNGCAIKSRDIVVENTTSVGDLTEEFQIFPNPASTFIRIKADFEWSARLIDSHGHEVTAIIRGGDKKISLYGLASGVYFLVLSDGESTMTKKVIVLR